MHNAEPVHRPGQHIAQFSHGARLMDPRPQCPGERRDTRALRGGEVPVEHWRRRDGGVLQSRENRSPGVVDDDDLQVPLGLAAPSPPALIVPREKPRPEQTIRARAPSRASAIDTARQEAATPALLSRWLAGAVSTRTDRSHVELGGLAAAARAAARLLTRTPEGELT